MLIGVDFDNTIADYDEAFVSLARELGLVPPDFRGSKKAVRDTIRLGTTGDDGWQKLQARAYGRDIGRAKLAEGIAELFSRAHERNIPVVIVSHKTEFSPFDRATNLRAAALSWMNDNGLFDSAKTGVTPENVYFEDTRDAKIERIKALGCTHFVDDLDEVFNEPAFPRNIKSYLYAAGYEQIPQGNFRTFRDHRQITDHLLGADPIVAARALCGVVDAIVPILHGHNNRLYKVTSSHRNFALKSYPAPDDDPRDRLGAEYWGLSFLKAVGESAVPAPVAVDRSMNIALYEWIDGDPITEASDSGLDQVLSFALRLHGYRRESASAQLPLASEACLSAGELVRQLTLREERLSSVASAEPALADFLQRLQNYRSRTVTALGVVSEKALDPQHRTLSPSDFGFHNALRRKSGAVVFLDFEYFGWDDPVKLTADLMLHPAMRLTPQQRRYVANGAADIYSSDPDFRARLARLLPLYVARWCLIILNEFLPERWARRVIAGGSDRDIVKVQQLAKAEALLEAAPLILKEVT